MRGAAPFLASTSKRIAAGALDLVPLFFIWMLITAAASDFGIPVVAIALLGPMTYIAYQATFLYYWDGESPGRRVCNARVVRADGTQFLGYARCVARPLIRIISIVAGGFLALWAGQIALGFGILIDIVLISSLPFKQSLADIVCHTMVVNTPPPQPHRAPAGPMYSAVDAEFGPRPRRVK
jgi:uncharacterized RDD family membrane protein YckC